MKYDCSERERCWQTNVAFHNFPPTATAAIAAAAASDVQNYVESH